MSRKEHRLQVLIPASLAARLRRAAERGRVSMGEWVRRALEGALATERAGPDPLDALSSLEGPTADVQQMLSEIEAGRNAG